MISYKEKLKNIKVFMFDVDGVLTDGLVYLMKDEVVRALNAKDGYALQYASEKLKDNDDIFLKAIKSKRDTLKNASKRIKDN